MASEPTATETQVIRLYRALLGRDPESAAVVAARVGRPLVDVAIDFARSPEFTAKSAPPAVADIAAAWDLVCPDQPLAAEWAAELRRLMLAGVARWPALFRHMLRLRQQNDDPATASAALAADGWPDLDDAASFGELDPAVSLLVVTRDAEAWIGAFASFYRDAGLDPIYAIERRTSDGSRDILARSGLRRFDYDARDDRLGAAIEQMPPELRTPWCLVLEDDELATGPLIAFAATVARGAGASIVDIPIARLRFDDANDRLQRSRFLAVGPDADFDRQPRLLRTGNGEASRRTRRGGGPVVAQPAGAAPAQATLLSFEGVLRTAAGRRVERAQDHRTGSDLAHELALLHAMEQAPEAWHVYQDITDPRLVALAWRVHRAGDVAARPPPRAAGAATASPWPDQLTVPPGRAARPAMTQPRTGQRRSGQRPTAQPRILELGGAYYFKAEYPERTTLLWSGLKLPLDRSLVDALATPERVAAELNAARRGAYDVVVAHPLLYGGAHPRYWGRGLLRSPLAPWAALTRAFGTSLLRYVDLPVPLVVIDMDDSFTLGRPAASLLDRADVFLKRELPVDRWQLLTGGFHRHIPTWRYRNNPKWRERLARIAPITLPQWLIDPALTHSAPPLKTADLFFAGAVEGNSTVREAGLEDIARLRARGVVVDHPRQPLEYGDYQRRMAAAWLAWSPSGRGWQCNRHYEAALVQTVPVVNYPTIIRHAPQEADVHAVYYAPEPGGLERAVIAALADTERLRRMAAAARDHAVAHHTRKAYCEHVLDLALGRHDWT